MEFFTNRRKIKTELLNHSRVQNIRFNVLAEVLESVSSWVSVFEVAMPRLLDWGKNVSKGDSNKSLAQIDTLLK